LRSITWPKIHSKSAAWVLGAIILFSGVVRYPCDDIRLLCRLLFEMAVAGAVVMTLWHINRWWAAFLALSTISFVFPFYDRSSYLAFNAVLYAAIWYIVVAAAVTQKSIPTILNAICIMALCHVAMQTVQHLGMDPWFVSTNHKHNLVPVGLMGNRNSTGALLALAFPAFLRSRWWILLPVIGYGLVLAASSGPALAVMVGAGFYLLTLTVIPPWVKWTALAAVTMVAILFFSFVDRPRIFSDSRWTAWHNAGFYLKQHWILGSGLGHWKEVFSRFPICKKLWWTTAHNEYFQTFFEMGMAAVVIMAGYVIQTAHRAWNLTTARRIPLTAMVVIFVNAMAHFTFHVGTTAMLAIIWMALMEVEA